MPSSESWGGRHGHGVPRRGPQAPPPGRGQGPPPRAGRRLGAERFLREIEIAANLADPHILPLYDSGEADGFLYYVMPYVEGESLRDLITRERQLHNVWTWFMKALMTFPR